MLERLRASADRDGLEIEVIQAGAEEPPPGPFDAVVERHLLWTLPDPGAALTAWRAVAPEGRLVLFEGLWGGADPVEAAARAGQGGVARSCAGSPTTTTTATTRSMLEELPLAGGTHPDRVVELVEAAGWGPARLERLRDVEWAQLLSSPRAPACSAPPPGSRWSPARPRLDSATARRRSRWQPTSSAPSARATCAPMSAAASPSTSAATAAASSWTGASSSTWSTPSRAGSAATRPRPPQYDRYRARARSPTLRRPRRRRRLPPLQPGSQKSRKKSFFDDLFD